MKIAFYKSPIGILKITSSDSALHKLELVEQKNDFECSAFNYKVIEQLESYFAGTLHSFNIPCAFDGCTEFQKTVYEKLLEVRFGKVKTYKELAEAVKNPKAFRAVGTAMAKNPIPIIIPCHRIVKTGGKIGSYSLGGVDTKKFLLDFEKSHS